MDDIISCKKLEQARKAAGLAQKDLYKAVNVSRATYHNWIVGKSEPSANQFFTMLDICWQKTKPANGKSEFDDLLNNLMSIGTDEKASN
ncbi:helix-turn-helix transcriptional regulator [Catenovulum sediminis]|uniref:Helix-turn-helix transcriptional regulator n=1 Tax=Catenovulum sediminis TaxID=1740262 RepID=A0ABV1RND0_9ALTE|nr:helix-turn-helix transcriptional regulator [Catenovulum sediminis]